jgi:hypothetical protein
LALINADFISRDVASRGAGSPVSLINVLDAQSPENPLRLHALATTPAN